jgi:nucleoside-diphosphate-sugar epimerase
MTVLVVGAGGFIGSELTARLAARGERVIAADIAPPDIDEVTAVECDVTNDGEIADIIDEHDPSAVVTLAYILGAESDQSPEQAVRVNCVGMDNVFRAATEAGVDRVAYASSIGVYGHPDAHDGPITETAESPAAYREYPLLFYSATKQLNEYQARLYADRGETEFVSVRPSIVFGPGREGGLTAWASTMVADLLDGDSTHLPFRPDQQLGLVYRDDVVDLFEAVLDADALEHHAYNTGSLAVTARELGETLTGELGGSITFDEDADPLPLVADVNHDRAAEAFDYQLTGLRNALSRQAAAIR